MEHARTWKQHVRTRNIQRQITGCVKKCPPNDVETLRQTSKRLLTHDTAEYRFMTTKIREQHRPPILPAKLQRPLPTHSSNFYQNCCRSTQAHKHIQLNCTTCTPHRRYVLDPACISAGQCCRLRMRQRCPATSCLRGRDLRAECHGSALARLPHPPLLPPPRSAGVIVSDQAENFVTYLAPRAADCLADAQMQQVVPLGTVCSG